MPDLPITWRLTRGGLAGLALLLFAALPAQAQTSLDDPDVAVEEGAEALGTPRWYNRQKDEFRPLAIQPPEAPKTQNTNRTSTLGNWGLSIGGWIRFLAWMALVVLLVMIAWLLIKSFLKRENSQFADIDEPQAPRPLDTTRVEELPLLLSTPPDDYLEAAHRHYRRGEFGPAILYLFSHQLLQLDRWHWIHLVKGKTNRQYLREVARSRSKQRDELLAIFEQTVLLFEEVYFGKRIPPQGAIDQAWGQIARFEAIVPFATELAA